MEKRIDRPAALSPVGARGCPLFRLVAPAAEVAPDGAEAPTHLLTAANVLGEFMTLAVEVIHRLITADNAQSGSLLFDLPPALAAQFLFLSHAGTLHPRAPGCQALVSTVGGNLSGHKVRAVGSSSLRSLSRPSVGVEASSGWRRRYFVARENR